MAHSVISPLEGDPADQAASYAQRLQELAKQSNCWQMTDMGTSHERARTGEQRRLPLSVTLEGQPMDVLFTVSVGSDIDEHGRPKPVGYGQRDGAKNAVEMAARNYAVVRAPYRDEAPYLVELLPEDIKSGVCDYSSSDPANPPGRVLARVPGQDEQPLRFDVAVGSDRWDPPATVEFSTTAAGDLLFSRSGNPQAYAMIAHQI